MSYINKESALRAIDSSNHSCLYSKEYEVYRNCRRAIANLSASDVAEVKRGEWIEEVVKIPCAWDEGGYETQINYVCSECGFVNDLGKTNGCPECLAKMDRGKENDLIKTQ